MAKKKTGIFYSKNPPGVVVMLHGKQIAHYDSVEEFVSAHDDGLKASKKINEQFHRVLTDQYKT